MVIQSLLDKPFFKNLTPAQQAMAAEKIGMKKQQALTYLNKCVLLYIYIYMERI